MVWLHKLGIYHLFPKYFYIYNIYIYISELSYRLSTHPVQYLGRWILIGKSRCRGGDPSDNAVERN